jgi:hypothetical protein
MQRNWVHSPHCPQTVKLLLHCLIRQAKIMCIKPLPNRSCSISMQATLMEQSIGATYMYPHVLHPKPKPVNHGACPPAEIHLRGFATRLKSWNRTRVAWNSQLLNMQNGCLNHLLLLGSQSLLQREALFTQCNLNWPILQTQLKSLGLVSRGV